MNNNLGKILIDLREKKGYTQKDLADKLNVSDKAISRWETGMSIPHVDTLVRISKIFKINLQDLIVAAASTDESDDELVQDIIKEFTRRDENKSKMIRIILSLTIIIILILTISIIFTKTYNRFKVYNVYVESDEIVSKVGIYVETKIKDSLSINYLSIKNYEVKNTDTVIVDLYYLENNKENILQTYTSLDVISFVNYDSYIKIDDLSNYMDNLFIRVKIIDNKNNEKEYTGKLQFVLDFSNNKIFYEENSLKSINNVEITKLSSDEVKEKLISNGFEKVNDDTLIKKLNNGNIYYIITSNFIRINIYEKDFSYKYTYRINNCILSVNVFNKNNIEIEDYEYDVQNKSVISCVIGNCNGYDKVLKFLNDNILINLK